MCCHAGNREEQTTRGRAGAVSDRRQCPAIAGGLQLTGSGRPSGSPNRGRAHTAITGPPRLLANRGGAAVRGACPPQGRLCRPSECGTETSPQRPQRTGTVRLSGATGECFTHQCSSRTCCRTSKATSRADQCRQTHRNHRGPRLLANRGGAAMRGACPPQGRLCRPSECATENSPQWPQRTGTVRPRRPCRRRCSVRRTGGRSLHSGG